MPVSFSDTWNMFLYNVEEDPSEAFVVIPQDEPIIPLNDQPVDDLNTPNSPIAETLNTETSTTEKGDISNLDSSADMSASNLPDDSQIKAEIEKSEFALVATDASTFITEHTAAKPLVPKALDTESSNAETGKVGDLNTLAETAAYNLSNDSQVETEKEHIKLISDVTEDSACLRGHNTDKSPDSNGKISHCSQSSNEDLRSSSAREDELVEDKLRKKPFLFDATALIIGLVVPILTIGFGAGNIGNCPANPYVPYLTLIMGILCLFIVSYPLLKATREYFDYWTDPGEDVIFIAFYILMGLWICKVEQFFTMDASFDLSAENYCNHAFYIFNIFLDIILALGFIL